MPWKQKGRGNPRPSTSQARVPPALMGERKPPLHPGAQKRGDANPAGKHIDISRLNLGYLDRLESLGAFIHLELHLVIFL